MSYLHSIAAGWMVNKYTAMPAKVVRFDFYNQCVDIIPCINVIDTGTNEEQERSLIPAVPIVFPCSSTSAITFPIKEGDFVLAVWSMRSVDNWKQNANGTPSDFRMFDVQDAFAIPCTFPRNQTKTRAGQSADDLVLVHNIGGSQCEIHLKASGDILAKTPATFKIEANSVEIDAPITTTSTITAAGNVVGAGVSLNSHTHGGVSSGGSNTGVPN